MKTLGKEFLVGCLVILVIGLMLVFAWLMGVVGPFHKEAVYHAHYAFAGGVEVGSPVRVSGVKVGKVERIEFLPASTDPKIDRATLDLTLTVNEKAASAVRQDSHFYVNMAGIIGERYIEVSPGTADSPILVAGSVVRGVDPPRIDQLLSQGYGVFGRIQDFLEQNEPVVTEFLNQTTKLLTDANRLLKGEEKKRFFALIDNANDLTLQLRDMTHRLQDSRSRQFFEEIEEMVHRAHSVDKPALKKFLQEEGVPRANLLRSCRSPNPNVRGNQ